MEAKVEGHLLSALAGECKGKLGPMLDSAAAELKLGRFPVSCLPHPAPEQHFGEMSANPLPFWDRCGSCHSQHQVALPLSALVCLCVCEKSDLMEIFLSKAVDLIFSLTFTQLER